MTESLGNVFDVEINRLTRDPLNARHVDDNDVASLAQSMSVIKQRQPITIRPSPTEGLWYVTAGWRRTMAALSLGWSMIKAVELEVDDGIGAEQLALAVSAAENMQRRAMHRVDQFRALSEMVRGGMTLEMAGDALGMTQAQARRVNKLGQISPALLDVMAEGAMPDDNSLRIIATAPVELQDAALAEVRRHYGPSDINWWEVAKRCQVSRIPQNRAIFDVATAGVLFEEDLFAQPGSPDQFTTTDIRGFLAAQAAAVNERVAASKGRIVAGKCDQWGAVVAPDGYRVTFDTVLKRFKKDDPRKIVLAVIEEGHRLGEVAERMAEPVAKKVRKEARHDDAQADSTVTRERPPISKAAQGKLAALKHDALVTALTAITEADNNFQATEVAADVLRGLLLCFAYTNVRVATGSQCYGVNSFAYRASKLVNADGTVNQAIGTRELIGLARDFIADATRFHHPNQLDSSGEAADWVGTLFGAQDFLGRFDSEEILKGLSSDFLYQLADAHGVSSRGTVSEVRNRLIGNMPGWKPVGFVQAKGEIWEEDEDEDADADADGETSAGSFADGELEVAAEEDVA